MALSLFDLPHREARRLLATGAPVWLGVNPIEYHGPHLSLHNDRLVSEGLARALHARLAERHPELPLLTAELELGVQPSPGPGTRPVAFPAARRAVLGSVRALAELGARRVVLNTFHGGPLHNVALQAGADWLVRRGIPACAPFHLVIHTLLGLDDPEPFRPAVAHLSQADADEVLAGLRFDFHGGFFETSMALLHAPDAVSLDHRELPACPAYAHDRLLSLGVRLARWLGLSTLAGELTFAAAGVAMARARPYHGYTSRPGLASAEAGRVFTESILDRYEPVVEGVLWRGEAGPRPAFRWMAPLTLGGRLLGEPQVPAGAVYSPS